MEDFKDGLPKNFLNSLRVLYDILDEDKNGYVHLRDIETRWNDRGVNGLPPGVLHALKNVAPANGFLTFDLFVSGLKLALVSNAKQKLRSATQTQESSIQKDIRQPVYSKPRVPVTAAIKPNNVLERPVSAVSRSKSFHQTNPTTRTTSHYGSNTLREPLKSWHKQQDLTKSEPIYVNVNHSHRKQSINCQRTSPKESTRRHTLTTGIDLDQALNIRLKQLSEEKTILLQGQHVVDETKDWYKKKLEQVNVKEKYARHYLFNSNSLVSHREQMNYQRTRIQGVNRHLKNLIDDNSKGFPNHINVSFREAPPSNQQLTRQNHILAKENKDKDSKITQLESEKRKLIRELFERKSEGEFGDGDVTFV
ncbi:hypothetical protein LOTGIDRAFT_109829 [Lottia gigantea]|uniref:Suppressor APC domain-containing protein n=1 Tax=Lottia gigantea TaxID=225164 RepID=V4B9F1_LOTGI|nr:hypothetical protein LOTGIDRAFT_109829 [Lottia gigantea]ESP04006.1 hypothetical protein LOTGIDRAFT_109829 [Lottia gigantea]